MKHETGVGLMALAFCGVMALMALTSFGAVKTATNGAHNWDDPDAWDPSGAPAAGDNARLDVWTVDKTLTLTNDMTTALNALVFTVGSARGRFVGTGHTFAPGVTSADAGWPFTIYTPHSSIFFNFNGNSTRAAYAWEDADIDFGLDGAVSVANFNAGTYNFYDADGEPTTRTLELFSITNAARVTFGPGTVLKAPCAKICNKSTKVPQGDVALVFNDATASLGDLTYASGGYAMPRNMDVVVSNQADVTVGKITYGHTTAIGTDGQPMRARLTVKDAQLTVTNYVEVRSGHKYAAYDILLDHATWLASYVPAKTPGTSTQYSGSVFGTGGANEVLNSLIVRDSKLYCSNSLFMLGTQYYSSLPTDTHTLMASFTDTDIDASYLALFPGTQSVGFTNCVINLLGGKIEWYLGKIPDERTAYFKDCVITNGSLNGQSGANGNGVYARLVFDNSYIRAKGYSTGASRLNLVFTNGTDVAFDSMGYIDGSTSVIDVVNAKFTLATGNTLGIGFNANGSKSRNLFHVGEGATVSLPAAYVGYIGNGHFLMDGGTLTMSGTMQVGSGAADGTSTDRGCCTYVQTDGLANVRTLTVGNKTGIGHNGKAVLDGGTMATLWSMSGNYKDGSSTAVLSANGGTAQIQTDSDRCFIDGFSTAEVGPKGLTVDPTGTKQLYILQTFTNKVGEAGLFRVSGTEAGTMTLKPAAWYVSKTQVDGPVTMKFNTALATETEIVAKDGGTALFDSGADVTAGALTISDGGIVKLAGTASLTVGDISVPNGTLVVDAGRTITVTGEADFSGLTVKCATDPTGTCTNDLFVIAGELSETVARQLARATMGNAMPDGLYGRLLTSYDSDTGRTTVRFAVAERSAPLADETTWKGTSGDLWNDAESGWTDGVPAASKCAVFAASESAAKAVTVPDGATVGAIGFTGTGYTLAGDGEMTMPSLPGAAAIESAAAVTNEFATDLWVQNGFDLTVGAGAQLTVSGDVDASNFTKLGTGELVLSGANDLGEKLVVAGGRTVANSAAALGAKAQTKGIVTMQESTLRIDSGDGSETVIEQPFQIATTNDRMYAILDCQTPVTIRDYRTPVRGGLLKRGPARLTIEVTDGQDLCAKRVRTANSYSIVNSFELAEDGSSPDASYQNIAGEMTSIEGELVLKRAPGETSIPKITMSEGSLSFGVRDCPQSVGTPRLVLDGVDFDRGQNAEQFWLQSKCPETAQTTELVLLNGARFYAYILYLGDVWSNGWEPLHTSVALTNATLQSSQAVYLNFANIAPVAVHATAWATIRAKDSSILSDQASIGFDGGLKASLANSVIAPSDKSSKTHATFTVGLGTSASGSFGYLELTEGSVFKVDALKATSWQPCYDYQVFTLAFDDSTWDYGTGDFTLGTSWITAANVSRFTIEMRGAGLRLAPASGTTFTTEYPFSGEGGLIVDGPGTVKFAADTLKFTGAAEVRQGTLDAGGQAVSVTLTNLTGANVPTLKDCAVDGRVLIDLADTTLVKGDTLTVAHLAGTSPTPVFKAVNAPKGLRGNFAVVDGEVKMTLAEKGGVAIVIR